MSCIQDIRRTNPETNTSRQNWEIMNQLSFLRITIVLCLLVSFMLYVNFIHTSSSTGLVYSVHNERVLSTTTHVQPTIDNNTLCPPDRPKPLVDDILCMAQIPFLSTYKNPCWKSQVSHRLRCLPYFQIIGMDKCGTTDIFDRLIKHPEICGNAGILGKEPSWWSWERYGLSVGDRLGRRLYFEDYLQFFNKLTSEVENQTEKRNTFITGDGTPMDMWDFRGWPQIPQNLYKKEPQILTPHLIKHINPYVKLIILLRNPVDRQYSDYFFMQLGNPNKSAKTFHTAVRNAVTILKECMDNHTLRWCLYDKDTHTKLNLQTRIHLGFYSVYMDEWLSVFPREQFFIARTEDYSKDIYTTMTEVFQFLGVAKLTRKEMEEHNITSPTHKYSTKSKKKAGSMLPETRQILTKLYQPFNDQLSAMLNDKSFTWADHT